MAFEPLIVDAIGMSQAAFSNGASRPGHRLKHGGALAPHLRGLKPGAIEVGTLIEETKPSLGLFVLDGLIAVELYAGRSTTAWLVGASDLIRPQRRGDISLSQRARWRVLMPTRILALTPEVCERARRSPAVFEHFLASATQTAHWLLSRSLVMSLRRIDDRLLALFALWGERWGSPTPDGIRLELPVTHRLISECCGAQRPSVTSALRGLGDEGFIVRDRPGDWLLRSSPAIAGTSLGWELSRSAPGLAG